MYKLILVTLLCLSFILLSACIPSAGVRNLQNGNKQATYEWQAKSDQIDIPFNWHDGHIIIPVAVNDSAPLRLAFDSGAAVTVLFETERTNQLKLDVERQLTLNSSGQIANVVNHNTLVLDKLSLENLTVLHVPLDHSPIFSNIEEAYFDGAIGYDLLSRFVIRIDYINQILTLSHRQSTEDNYLGWRALPIDTKTHVPYLEAFFGTGKSSQGDSAANNAKFLIDTGAPFYLYINPDLHPLLELPVQYYETKGSGFNGPYHRYTGRLEQLTIGEYSFPNLATHFDKTDYQDLEGIGLIGNGLLKKFDLVFDYASETLFIKSHSQFNNKSLVDRSGLDIKPHRKGAIVHSVALNSAAANAGLKTGDIITKFNGELILPATFDEFKAKLSSEIDTTQLCWDREAMEMCEQITLSKRIRKVLE